MHHLFMQPACQQITDQLSQEPGSKNKDNSALILNLQLFPDNR